MISPATLTRYSPDELLELANGTLAELIRRTRPTPENAHFVASLRAGMTSLEQIETMYARLPEQLAAEAAGPHNNA